jgi:drug/metabolite transporter (DMT)-like permease
LTTADRGVQPREQRLQHLLALLLAVAAGTLWGLGGVAAQLLFERHAIDPRWLVTMRMAGGGLILLAMLRPAWPGSAWPFLAVWGVLGIGGTQLLWYVAISLSNAATATFIQYFYVAITAGWQMARGQVGATAGRVITVVVAAAGVTLLVLPDPGSGLRLGAPAVAFAFGSALTAAFLFLGSARVTRSVGPGSSTAWGLLFGGAPALVVAPPWDVHPTGDLLGAAALIAFVVLGSTVLAFLLSLASLRRITATEAVVASAVEPAVAALGAFFALGVRLAPLQYAGGALVLLAVVLLAVLRR